jgi:CelD/BcsL family acetyltransferase involved in cellulose biosynthesis
LLKISCQDRRRTTTQHRRKPQLTVNRTQALSLAPHQPGDAGALRSRSGTNDIVMLRTRARVELSVHSDLRAVEQQWRAFEQRADCTAFQTFDWLAAWQRHIGVRSGLTPAIVVGRVNGGETLFILPLAVGSRGPLRYLTWLGGDFCDYHAPLLAEEFSQHVAPHEFGPVWRTVVGAVRNSPRLGFDFVDLRKMPETIGSQRNPFMDLAVAINPSGTYSTTLGPDWATFYGKRSSATRRRDRTKVRRLSEHGEVSYGEPATTEEMQHTLHALFEQKSQSLTRMGVPDLFARPGYREFFLDVATCGDLREFVHVSRLRVGSTIAAANLGLMFRGRFYHLLMSYQDGELARFGPGAAHLRELLRNATERGFHTFDFTIGDEPYKREWCDCAEKLYDHLAAAGIRGVPAVIFYTAAVRMKRFIKQTPVLWQAVGTLRSRVGAVMSR